MLDPPGISESESLDPPPPPPHTHTHTYMLNNLKKNTTPELAFATPVYRMRLKAVVPSSYNLNSRWVVKQKYSNCQWTWTPWFDPRVPLMCNSRDFRQGMGGGIVSVIFVCRQCGPRSGPTDPNCLKLWQYFWYFFFAYTLSRNKGADKTGGAQAGLGICCSNVSKANFSW